MVNFNYLLEEDKHFFNNDLKKSIELKFLPFELKLDQNSRF
jgi:hypothetical protein